MRRSALVLLPLLALAAAGCALRAPDPLPSAHPPSLELRIADRMPHPGWLLFQPPDAAEPLYLDPRAVLGSRDLAAVGAETTAEGLRLDLWLTSAGAERLSRATADNVGRWLAVVVNGQVRSAVPIAQSIQGTGVPLHVPLRLEGAEARRLQAQIRAGWPPRPS